MRTKQKLMSVLLVLAMALTLLPTAAFAAVTHDKSSGCSSATYTKVDGTAATCAADGFKDAYQCSVCNDYVEDSAGATAIGDSSDYGTWKASGGGGFISKSTVAHTWNATSGKCDVCQTACTHDWSDNSGTCKTCKMVCDHSGESGATCSVCGATLSTSGPTAAKITGATFTIDPSDPTKGTLSWTYTPAKDNDGNDVTGKDTFTVTVPADPAGFSAATPSGSNGSWTSVITVPADLADGTYTFTIADSSDTPVTATATYNKGGVAPVVTPDAITVSGAEYQALPGGTYLALTWYLTKDGTKVEIAETDFTVTVEGVAYPVSASPSSGVYSAEVSLATPLPGGVYTVAVADQAGTISGSTTFIATGSSSSDETPGVTGNIPNASEVTSPEAADAAVETLKNENTDTLVKDLESSETTVSNFAALETAVAAQNQITVTVNPHSAAPSELKTKVSVTGAAFNAKTSNSTVELVVDKAASDHTLGSRYDSTNAVHFSMTMTGVNNPSKLDVPVIVTLPIPSGISTNRIVVLHYHNERSAEVLNHKVEKNYVSFVVTGFSDFVIAETVKRTSGSGGGGGGSSLSNPVVVTPPSTTTTTPSGIFTDVPANYWAATQIAWARDNSVMNGTGGGAFSPDRQVNRQQLWMVLARLSGEAPADMAAARQWAMSAEISDGSSPDGTMSRQQLVTMLYRYAQAQGKTLDNPADLSSYPDHSAVASYAGEALAWAVGNGIVTGTADGRLNPEGTATRAQFAVILYRFSQQG